MEWITSENTYEESWRRILEFANIELAVDAIEVFHGKITKENSQNYKKQATQARASLLQAKEYFDAAKESTLFTKPNHLYYGSVALSTACMLIRGDGSKSLDLLRKDNKNCHHGLDFSFSSDINRSKKGVSLLENSFIKICPHGHFSNWYNTLTKQQPVDAICEDFYSNGIAKYRETIGNFKIPEFSELISTKSTIISIAKRLPDLHMDLQRYGVSVEYARGEHVARRNKEKNQQQSFFIFHSSPTHEILLSVIDQFNHTNGVFCLDLKPGDTSAAIETKQDNNSPFSFPDSRETIDHKTIFYKESVNMPEIVDLFTIGYALSMLSRYYPDIWISFLESHCKGAKLVERIIRILMLKTPNLMLNQIYGGNLIISNHRPPWH